MEVKERFYKKNSISFCLEFLFSSFINYASYYRQHLSCLSYFVVFYYLFEREILLITCVTIRSSICGFCLIWPLVLITLWKMGHTSEWAYAFTMSELMHLQFSGWTFHYKRWVISCFYLLWNRYIFSTEGHLLPATPQISLVREHCLYYGAYCRSGDLRQNYFVSEADRDKQESNDSRFYGSWTKATYSSDYTTFEPTAVSGLIKVLSSSTLSSHYSLSIRDTPIERNN